MKFYSDITKRFYEDVKSLEKEEKEFAQESATKKKKAEEKKKRAEEVTQAFKLAEDQKKKATELRNKFIEDYGSFYVSYNTIAEPDWFSEDWFSLLRTILYR